MKSDTEDTSKESRRITLEKMNDGYERRNREQVPAFLCMCELDFYAESAFKDEFTHAFTEIHV